MKTFEQFINENFDLEKTIQSLGNIQRHDLAERISGQRFSGGAKNFTGKNGVEKLLSIIKDSGKNEKEIEKIINLTTI